MPYDLLKECSRSKSNFLTNTLFLFFALFPSHYFRECVVAPQGETNKFFARTRFNLAQPPTRKKI